MVLLTTVLLVAVLLVVVLVAVDLVAAVFGRGVAETVDLVRVAAGLAFAAGLLPPFLAAVLVATLALVPKVFSLTVFSLTEDFAFEAPAFGLAVAAVFFAADVLTGDFGFALRVVLAGFFFAVPLDAAVFLAGAFSGVVLFPEAELH